MKAHIGIWLVALLSAMTDCAGQGTLNITFDGPPPQPPGTAYSVQGYDESGMSFRPIDAGSTFTRHGGGVSTSPENGTTYLRAAFTQSLMFSFSNGSLFSLNAVDLAEYSTTVPDAVTVHFIGYRPDGSTVSTDFTTDGIIDGTGPLADFQTFNFQGFTGLSRVEIPTYGWSLDNLMVTAHSGARHRRSAGTGSRPGRHSLVQTKTVAGNSSAHSATGPFPDSREWVFGNQPRRNTFSVSSQVASGKVLDALLTTAILLTTT